MNEYGITVIDTGATEHFADEETFYGRLGLPWIPPELRRGSDELDVARRGDLPGLIAETDLRGDLHLHSNGVTVSFRWKRW